MLKSWSKRKKQKCLSRARKKNLNYRNRCKQKKRANKTTL